jgi:hypothetical protein
VAGAALPALVGLEHDAAALDSDRRAVAHHDLGEADARHVAGRHQPRQQVQAPVGRAPAGRVQDALRLERVAVCGGHHDAETREAEGNRRERHRVSP